MGTVTAKGACGSTRGGVGNLDRVEGRGARHECLGGTEDAGLTFKFFSKSISDCRARLRSVGRTGIRGLHAPLSVQSRSSVCC